MVARIKFTKTGSSKFIGHLDLLRYFQKAFKRAKLDLTYSQGFNPRQLITFAAPLGVGLTSEAEYLDVTLNSCDEPDEMIDKLNNEMANNIRIKDFIILPEDSKNAMSVVAAADYLISLKEEYNFISEEGFQSKFIEFYNQDSINITKKTKKSEIKIDLKTLIYEVKFIEKKAKLFVKLATGSVNNIKPELVLETFCQFIDRPYKQFAFQTHRLEVYADANEDKQKIDTAINFVPLNKMYD